MTHSLSDKFSRMTTGTSARSSISSTGITESVKTVPDYCTGDAKEDRRLKNLHHAAIEFQDVQTKYVQYLIEMAILFPAHLKKQSERVGRNLLKLPNGLDNVVVEIERELLEVLPIHKELLRDIIAVCSNFDSRNPTLSKTMALFVGYLKCCQVFVANKDDLQKKFTDLRRNDAEFDKATSQFEIEVFQQGKQGAMSSQLDQVHQNFMRYKLLMTRYFEYLEDKSEEKSAAKDVIDKLEKMVQSVDERKGLPANKEVTDVHYRFQGHFNVYEPGRVLIRQNEVKKQSRKEEQTRHLVLFSDFLWICRAKTANDPFEIDRSYRIPLELMSFERMGDEVNVPSLTIKSKFKSSVFIFEKENDVNEWFDDLTKAQFDRQSYKKRQSAAVQKHDEDMSTMKRRMKEVKLSGEEGQTERQKSLMSELRMNKLFSVASTSENVETVKNSVNIETKKEEVDEVKPVWLPDNKSNECLMEGCSTTFNVFNRRHHCRDCGLLICKNCTGQAPVSKFKYKKKNVCPECFVNISGLYNTGNLYPTKCLVNAKGIYLVKVGKKQKDPRLSFNCPKNISLKKRNTDEKRERSLVFEEVHLRRGKSEVVRHAFLLRDDSKLVFYKAELDRKAVLEVDVSGYFYKETYLGKSDGWLFELAPRHSSITKKQAITFRVESKTSAKKWSTAFADKLKPASPEVSSADC